MGTALAILGASVVIALGLMGIAAILVFMMDNKKYRDMIKNITC